MYFLALLEGGAKSEKHKSAFFIICTERRCPKVMKQVCFISDFCGPHQHTTRVDDFAKTRFFVENMQNALVTGGEKGFKM